MGLKILFQLMQLLVILPIQLYLTYLVYTHIQATDHMWFVWIASAVVGLVITIGLTTATVIVDHKAKEEAVEEILKAVKKKA